MDSAKISFGEAVQRLEAIVKKLEQNEIALEESSALFEEGVKLANFCSKRLLEAETKIEQLTRDGRDELTTKAAPSVDE